MKYLITGITGFAGPHLANLLIKEGGKISNFLLSIQRKSKGNS
jgi:nucleoside-diphosphate-sugar epimerase